ncbi:hypothetical protein SAZ11_47670 [Streptomyces sp. FXJ1.4098]|nr:hypothetical protein [Streptomyces sp. FXJ1.4098]
MYLNDATRQSLLAQLRQNADAPGRRVLLTGATVVSMDPAVGVLEKGDVLIEGEVIAAVGEDLRTQGSIADAVVIDAAGCIITPVSSTPTGTPGRRSCGGSCPTSTTWPGMSPTPCWASRRCTGPPTCTSAPSWRR